ncbi:hypothetical protein CTAYLR_005751 [Chrysophaeum taylorii]|uniref:PARP-type domain-containing protein n=1 Tax=Chrysophaeum taylorii TaxID=2483200 RepID=A0AAD7XRZ6_9STRA|nr:hypothetical protein CTAYLR_005751 [Chrysophaeum taylorii]
MMPTTNTAAAESANNHAQLLAKLGVAMSGGSKGASQRDHGHIGGLVAGRLGDNKYVVDYAVDGRSKCRHASCKEQIEQGVLRIGKIPPALRTGHAIRTQWYHPECIFKSFSRMTKTTKTIHCVEDLDGFHKLIPSDQDLVKSYVHNRHLSHAESLDQRAGEQTRSTSPQQHSNPMVPLGLMLLNQNQCMAPAPDIPMGSPPPPGNSPTLLFDLDASAVASRICSLGPAFEKVSTRFVECGIDGKYILTRTPAEFDEILCDLGVNDSTTGRQKRRRISYELGLCV